MTKENNKTSIFSGLDSLAKRPLLHSKVESYIHFTQKSMDWYDREHEHDASLRCFLNGGLRKESIESQEAASFSDFLDVFFNQDEDEDLEFALLVSSTKPSSALNY